MTMITPSKDSLQSQVAQTGGWQRQLQDAVRDAGLLAQILNIELDDIDTGFPLLVPLPYLQRIRPGDRQDPLLRQVLPTGAELIEQHGFSTDPVSEQPMSAGKGLIQKYQGRALVIATGTCAVNCRYCFRRHYPYDTQRLSGSDWERLMAHIANDDSIQEVILSGGDPLILNDRQLASIISALNDVAHVTSIRFHTRLPVVIPERVCESLLSWVDSCRKQLVFVTHINHPNELDQSLTTALQTLAERGPVLLNQSVLLRGVNDNPDTLALLSRKLFAARVLPYYLHLLDPVQGAGHFDVPEAEGRSLIQHISAQLPGYLVPKLAREVPGAPSKQVLAG